MLRHGLAEDFDAADLVEQRGLATADQPVADDEDVLRAHRPRATGAPPRATWRRAPPYGFGWRLGGPLGCRSASNCHPPKRVSLPCSLLSMLLQDSSKALGGNRAVKTVNHQKQLSCFPELLV